MNVGLLGNYAFLRRNTKIIHTPKDGASDAKKLYTVLAYKDVELTTKDGKTKKATTGLVKDYVNKFGKSGENVSEYHYLYDSWGNITAIYGVSVQYDNLTRNQERAIEQYFISKPNGPNELNKINSIGINNQYYHNAVDWARKYLGK